MSTIFTDHFAYQDIDISIADLEMGHGGRELIFAAGDTHEIRVTLTDAQLADLVYQIELSGIERGAS